MARAAVGVALALACGLPAFAQAKKADLDAEEAVKRFVREMNAADAGEDDRLTAIRRVAKTRHPRVVEALAPYLTAGDARQRIAVARALAGFDRVPGTVKALADGYTNEVNQGDGTRGVRIEMLRAFGALKAKEAAPLVNKAIEEKFIWIAKAGIDAAAKIRHKTSIEPLLRQLYRIEGKEGNKVVDMKEVEGNWIDDTLGTAAQPFSMSPTFAEANEKPMGKTEREILRDPVLAALKSITRQNFGTHAEWNRWWVNNRRTFEVPR